MATAPAPTTSEKYRQIRTIEIVDLMEAQGWLPMSITLSNTRIEDRKGFQKHMIRFRHVSSLQNVSVNSVFPEAVLTNSHDGTSAYKIMAGLFRLVCGNGMVVSAGVFETIRIVHLGLEPSMVAGRISEFGDRISNVSKRIDTYKAIQLSPQERLLLAEAAIVAKLNPGEDVKIERQPEVVRLQIGNRVFNPAALLRPVRPADEGESLWNTFNVIQEKITKGSRYEIDHPESRWASPKRVRAISGVDETVRVNRALFHLLDNLAKAKGAN